MALKFLQRKAVLVEWDVTVVKGQTASIQAAHGTDDFAEKRSVPNHGGVVVTYGESFTGDSSIKVVGSHGGEDEGVATVV
jgi:hypothetical protein